jgi:hypothetical protein
MSKLQELRAARAEIDRQIETERVRIDMAGAERMAKILAERKPREDAAIAKARAEGKCVSYVDTDGCEVTATPGGHTFYNAADWW